MQKCRKIVSVYLQTLIFYIISKKKSNQWQPIKFDTSSAQCKLQLATMGQCNIAVCLSKSPTNCETNHELESGKEKNSKQHFPYTFLHT